MSTFNNKGLSFTGFIFSLIALLGVGYFSYHWLQSQYHSKESKEIQNDISNLKKMIQSRLDCQRTWLDNAINLSQDCLPSLNPKSILLKDKEGQTITSPLTPKSTENFNPIHPDGSDSGEVGPWMIRAYCDSQIKSLIIRIARKGENKETLFFVDPKSKKVFDWGFSPENPIWGSPGNHLCSENFEAKPVEKKMAEVPATLPTQYFKRYILDFENASHWGAKKVSSCKSLVEKSENLFSAQVTCKKFCNNEGFLSGYFEDCCSPPTCKSSSVSCVCVRN